MNFLSFLLLIVVSFFTGSIGAKIAGRKRLGCLPSIVLGFIGAIIGTFLAEKLDLPLLLSFHAGSHPFPIIWAVIGSALFVAFLNLFTKS